MVFDLTENQPVWFDFPGGGRVQLRTLSTADVLRIEKETTEHRPYLYEPVNEKGDKLPPRILNHDIVDTDKQNQLHFDCCIVDWENFFDKDGNLVPCTKETKTLLMRLKDPTFRDFVNEKLTALGEAEKAKQDEAVKNSLAG